MPCGATKNIQDVFCRLYNGSYQPIEVVIGDDGNFEVFTPHTWDTWLEKDIHEGSETIRTTHNEIEIPLVVVCKNYNKIPKISCGVVTKEKIYERDDYTCVYTGKKLKRRELSVDHVIPTSIGNCKCGCGKSTCWNNMVTCDARINHLKSNYSLEQIPKRILDKMGVSELKLRYEPFTPKYKTIGGGLNEAQKKFLV